MSALLAGIVQSSVGTGLRAQITYLLDVILMNGSDGDGIGGGRLKNDSESKSGLYDKGQIHPTESLHRIIYHPAHRFRANDQKLQPTPTTNNIRPNPTTPHTPNQNPTPASTYKLEPRKCSTDGTRKNICREGRGI
jgi:hypothetical protein